VNIPADVDGSGYQMLFFTATGDFEYIWLEPEDRLTTATPIKGWLFFAGYNLIPASIDAAEGGQFGSQGGQDTAGGKAFLYGGAAFSNDSSTSRVAPISMCMEGQRPVGAVNSGLSEAAGDINGGNGEILGGDFANGGHLGDLTIANWRNLAVTAVGTMTLTGTVVSGGTGLAVANVGANSCGTTAATVAGGPNSFEVTVGATSGTQCRVAFPIAAPNRWNCAPTNNVTGNLVRAVAVDTNVDPIGVFVAADVECDLRPSLEGSYDHFSPFPAFFGNARSHKAHRTCLGGH
jgi:hypothetical protein